MPAQAVDDASVAGKRTPSSSPKASTSMPKAQLASGLGEMPGGKNAGDDAERPVEHAGIDHGIDVRADQQALFARPANAPRTVPSASSLHGEPRLAASSSPRCRRRAGARASGNCRTSRFGSAEIEPRMWIMLSARSPSAEGSISAN